MRWEKSARGVPGRRKYGPAPRSRRAVHLIGRTSGGVGWQKNRGFPKNSAWPAAPPQPASSKPRFSTPVTVGRAMTVPEQHAYGEELYFNEGNGTELPVRPVG